MSIEQAPNHRFFLEVSYKGTEYSGFQAQKNANTVQAEVEKAFEILQKQKIDLTGSSRTDAGVHALQNYFHFDYDGVLHEELIYKLNAILPSDIVVKRIFPVGPEAHCRFDAVSREYHYHIYKRKDPFLQDRAFYFPYKLNIEKMQLAAELLKKYNDFTSFSKRNTQAKTAICNITESEWFQHEDQLIYRVSANRFLRGMVRALTATMLMTGRNKLSLDGFAEIIEARDCTRASFAVPAKGLFLQKVIFTYALPLISQ